MLMLCFGKIKLIKHSPQKLIAVSRPRLKNIDRNSAQELSVTVGNITVTITDYKLLSDDSSISDSLSHSTSNESLDSSLTSSEQSADVIQRNDSMSIDS